MINLDRKASLTAQARAGDTFAKAILDALLLESSELPNPFTPSGGLWSVIGDASVSGEVITNVIRMLSGTTLTLKDPTGNVLAIENDLGTTCSFTINGNTIQVTGSTTRLELRQFKTDAAGSNEGWRLAAHQDYTGGNIFTLGDNAVVAFDRKFAIGFDGSMKSNPDNDSMSGAEASFFAGTFDGTVDQAVLKVRPIIDKVSGNYTAIYVDVTETAAPDSTNALMNLRIGGVSKFIVNASGLASNGVRSTPDLAHASIFQAGVYLSPVVDKAAGAYTALHIEPIETSAPSANNNLITAKVGGETRFQVAASKLALEGVLLDGTFNDPATFQSVLKIRPTINKVAGGYNAIDVNVTETSAPGTNKFLDLKVATVQKFTVDTTGDTEVYTIGKGYVLKSPDGTRYRISVANGGALSTVAA